MSSPTGEGEDKVSAEEIHALLSKDSANFFTKKTWKDEDDDDDDLSSDFPLEEEEDEESVPVVSTTRTPSVPRKTKKKAASFCLVLCLVGFVVLLVAGSWLSADTSNATSSQIAGYALLTVVGICLLFPLLACCLTCCSGGGGSTSELFGGSPSRFKDEFDVNDVHQRRTRPKFIFKTWGDDLRLDLNQHELLLKTTMKTLSKPVRQELKQALKAKREQSRKDREAKENRLRAYISQQLQTEKQDPLQLVRDLRKRVYVMEFHANTSVEDLAQQVTLLSKVANPKQDIVLLRLNSPGGYVSEYGLASSQLIRLRELGLRTIACVDTVAASGGYMMCCVCDEVFAAPFAFVGSIGVITYIPNLDRVTKETLKIDVHQFTAGKHKRTVDLFGEVTEEGKAKLKEELTVMHTEFKNHVKKQRGNKLKRDIEDVATGEAWLAVNALELGLIDRLVTSHQVLAEFSLEYDVLVLTEFQQPKSRGLKELLGASSTLKQLVSGFFREQVVEQQPRFEMV